MNGTALSWRETDSKAWGKILDEDGLKYKVHGGSVERDSIGRELLIKGEPVSFAVDKNGPERRATNVRRPWKETIDPNGHVELCLVRDQHWLLRQIGGLLTVEFGAKSWIRSNQLVECSVEQEFFDGRDRWRAVNVALVSESADSFNGFWRGMAGMPVFPQSGL